MYFCYEAYFACFKIKNYCESTHLGIADPQQDSWLKSMFFGRGWQTLKVRWLFAFYIGIKNTFPPWVIFVLHLFYSDRRPEMSDAGCLFCCNPIRSWIVALFNNTIDEHWTWYIYMFSAFTHSIDIMYI